MKNHRIIDVAAHLVSERGENPEYDRALTELSCEMLGLSMEHKEVVAQIIGVHADSIRAWSSTPVDPEAMVNAQDDHRQRVLCAVVVGRSICQRSANHAGAHSWRLV